MAVLLTVHVAVAPLSILAAMQNMRGLGTVVERAAESLPADGGVREQWVVIVNTPTAFISGYGPVLQALNGRPVPARTLILGSSLYATEVERRDEHTLVLRPEAGYLAPPGTPRPGAEAPVFLPFYLLQMLDHLFRDVEADPFGLGERVELTGLTVEILAVADGRPSAVGFRFDRRLEDPLLRWLRWDDGVYRPFAPPAPGGTVTLAAPRLPLP